MRLKTVLLVTSLIFATASARAERGMTTASGAPVVAAETAAATNVTEDIASVADAVAANGESKSEAKADEKSEVKAEAKADKDQFANKKESEIPLSLDAPKKAEGDSHPIFKILLVFSLMGVVGTGAFLFLKKYSKTNFAAGRNNQIKVITQHHLGPKKSLAIIRVAGESILIGVTDQNISMIKSLSLLDDEVPEATPHHFSEVFGGDETMPAIAESAEEEDEFSIRGVKDAVSKKLKGMRSFQ